MSPDVLAPLITHADDTALMRLRARLAQESESAHLLDVAYRTVETPVGTLLLVATERGLVRVAYEREDHDAVLASVAARVSPRILRAPARLDDVARELDEYFSRRRHGFDLPLDLQLARAVSAYGARALAPDRLRPHRQLRSHRDQGRQPDGSARRRKRLRQEPTARRRAVPPSCAQRRSGRPVRRRRRGEADAACTRSRLSSARGMAR